MFEAAAVVAEHDNVQLSGPQSNAHCTPRHQGEPIGFVWLHRIVACGQSSSRPRLAQ
ncbi:hypothetical protein HaLaN_18899, partial [Haematococcus lacustris]